ncbi:TPA: glycosyl transferase family protein [Burkholderia aenigmatica]|uniref:glycosyl transferase family protein n=1 Tax=Burkholderia sp. AU45251 TaxID=3059204 RepID=UPI0026572B2A|nr:glycosyl transferase family protein [Burkholderia sp. AU45251]HDR9483970.1 glycosyl transferase family protein [Burkholderia aenigmatica]MDN7516230.1 glycosyl transferase family protein [Burkholderia sp. AU45251]HDR9514935.1 glycosyl transferase family protein [Burkholderia aenigmatica]HDR9592020.1 glycosyl transferase family protein [Burkholderia aenigmatica]HDR9601204.1 glycosyl transferase family protein [Burkholderia aenigmatica]
MMDNMIWSAYLYALNLVTIVTAIVILVSTLDDLTLDACYWSFEIGRILRREKSQTIDIGMLRALEERHLALMVPAWKEYDVIAKMIENTLATLEYERYVIFVGTYHNDAETTAEVERMVRRYPGRVTRATVMNDGPTCKADCLNWIVEAILRYEAVHHIQFAGVVMHDCEDVIHPVELKYLNHAVAESDLVQLPVLSLPRKWNEFVAGCYLDDFSETHQKDVPVRARLTGIVPGAGVASCYSRRSIEAAMKERNGCPFNTSSLTEDYDFSFRLRDLGMKETFARFPLSDIARDTGAERASGSSSVVNRNLLATREYFPKTFRTAYRQRARWILGIAFQGWEQLGWKGNLLTRYMFFHDRKGIVTSLFSVIAYGVLLNFLLLAALQKAGHAIPVGATALAASPWVAPLLWVNTAMLFARAGQRYHFVSKLNGPVQGLLSIPRMFVNNLINFYAVCRAWRIYLGHLASGKPIAWDKTSHTYLSNKELGKVRLKIGEILVDWGVVTLEQLQASLEKQLICGKRLGELLIEGSALSTESLADAIAEQAELPRVCLSNVAVGHFADSLAFELQYAYRAVPFSTADDGTLNIAVGRPLTPDEQDVVRRGARAKVAYFIACDLEITAELARHSRFVELVRARDGDPSAQQDAPTKKPSGEQA